jgi:hypothetical protein
MFSRFYPSLDAGKICQNLIVICSFWSEFFRIMDGPFFKHFRVIIACVGHLKMVTESVEKKKKYEFIET